jgi:hypothetical protein
MFKYNVTIKVQADIQKDWLVWLKETHIPEVLATECFRDAVVHRLLEIDDSEGPTFAVQYTAESKAAYNQYIETFAPALRQKSFDAWGDRFIAFRSLMQVIN